MWTKSFSRYTHILLVSAAVIIGAQISISLFESDFRVSIGIFGIFMSLILFGKYPILPVTVISALCVFFSRTLMHWLRFGSWNPQNYFPEMFSIWSTESFFFSTAVKMTMNFRCILCPGCFFLTIWQI